MTTVTKEPDQKTKDSRRFLVKLEIRKTEWTLHVPCEHCGEVTEVPNTADLAICDKCRYNMFPWD
jgi:rRNA maturation protein Nop10